MDDERYPRCPTCGTEVLLDPVAAGGYISIEYRCAEHGVIWSAA